MNKAGILQNVETPLGEPGDELNPLYCWECHLNFTSEGYLYKHLIHHVRQPCVVVSKLTLPPLKLVFKNRSGNSFEIVNSPSQQGESPRNGANLAGNEENPSPPGIVDNASSCGSQLDGLDDKKEDSFITACFSDTFGDVNGLTSPAISERSSNNETTSPRPEGLNTPEANASSEFGGIPGAEPTPPPEPSPEYPKIRIKTTGLLKEPLTITEITDDNPDGIPQINQSTSSIWSLEDPLKLPDDDSNLLSLFNNNERAKDLGFTTSESEFISLDRLDDRNRGALQLYNPNNAQATSTSTALESLTGLPMQALAQQVSRLQPSGNGLHQQNVLINIQQFPQAPPPQPNYQPPPMYHHPPPPQQMYQPYQYQPPNPYYPQPPGYPQHMPPPQPPMGQMGQPPMGQQPMQQGPMGQQPPMNQNQLVPVSQQGGPSQQGQPQPGGQQSAMQGGMTQSGQYRQPMPPRPGGPRQPGPGQRLPPPRQIMQPRQPGGGIRPRGPLVRPRGAMTATRGGMRPRAPGPNGQQARPPNSPVKRTPDQQNMQAKKKKFDVLTPDRDDEDCQVICTQPKNMDGGLPQIESVSGGQSDSAENSIMHLSDSITLSVRNPPPKEQQSPKKSEANAVANILATRGITVTASGAKPKEKEPSQNNTLSASLNLNGAVSIIPAGKSNGSKSSNHENQMPTVDLTDDASDMKMSSSSKQKPGLPFRCELCPAQYPNAAGLSKHRQNYHKTTSGMPELGIPVINLKQPGIMQKLTNFGITNYIPIPSSGPDGTFCIPIISTRNTGNIAAMGVQSMITLGPIRSIQKPNNATNAPKQSDKQ